MSKLDELIKKLCPNGVEYKRLGEVGKFYGGLSGKNRNDFVNGNKTFITYMNIYKNIELDIEAKEKVRIKENEKQNKIEYGDVLFTGSSENREECGLSSALTQKTDEELYLNSFCFGFRFNNSKIMIPQFSKYIFRSNTVRKQIMRIASGVTRFNVSKKKMENVVIAIPPLEIQSKIVHILDDFTQLSAELSAELKARKKQYEHYENKLLFENNYDLVKLEQLCNVNQGLQIPINKRFKGNGKNRYLYITVQFLKNKDDEQYYIENPNKNVVCKKEDILVTRTGSTGVIITGIEGCFHNNFFKVKCNEKIYNRYMYYILKSRKMYNKMLAAASGGTVPDLPHKRFYNLEIPLPNIDTQKKIVNVLEKFEKLCSDISEGLPAEIEARQKQYEYYRDKLLTFKELKEED